MLSAVPPAKLPFTVKPSKTTPGTVAVLLELMTTVPPVLLRLASEMIVAAAPFVDWTVTPLLMVNTPPSS